MLIIRTLPDKKDPAGSGPMLQDTIAGKVYTHRRPYLVEMNNFIEGFLNKQMTGNHVRPAQLAIVVGTEDCERLKDGVSDQDLADAWDEFLKDLRKENPKAEAKLTNDEWKEFCQQWVKANSGGRKTAAADDKGADGKGAEGGKGANEGGPANQGGRPPRNA